MREAGIWGKEKANRRFHYLPETFTSLSLRMGPLGLLALFVGANVICPMRCTHLS